MEEEFTYERYKALCEEHKKRPPTKVLMAAQVGYEPPKGIEDFMSLVGADGALNLPVS